ncbi:hypothetical protein LINPERHAP2_LOCUS38205, partial [Linum perenne]
FFFLQPKSPQLSYSFCIYFSSRRNCWLILKIHKVQVYQKWHFHVFFPPIN